MSAHLQPEHGNGGGRAGLLTVPNLISLARLAGAGVLLWLAHAGHAMAFVVLFALLMLSDWIDGKLAVLLDQRSELGARLDSVSDAVLYACLLLGTAMLKPAIFRAEAVLIAAMLGSYAVVVAVSLLRFGRLPAFHTRAAKTCWFLVALGAFVMLLDGPVWPAQIAVIGVIITNIEAMAIACVLKEWQTDVPSIWHAVRIARRE